MILLLGTSDDLAVALSSRPGSASGWSLDELSEGPAQRAGRLRWPSGVPGRALLPGGPSVPFELPPL